MSHKESWHRTNKQDFKKYQNSKIWDNFKKNKESQEEVNKQGIEIVEEKKK